MDQSLDKNTGDLAIAEAAQNARRDRRKHDIVEHGLLLQQSGNTMSAVEYLKASDIDLHVIRRVLLEPQCRRRGN